MINDLYGITEMMRIEDFIKQKFNEELIFSSMQFKIQIYPNNLNSIRCQQSYLF